MDGRSCLQLGSRSPAFSGGGSAFTPATKGLKAQGIGGLIRTILPHYSVLLFLFRCFSMLLMCERIPKVVLLQSFLLRCSSALRSSCCQSQKLQMRPDCGFTFVSFVLFPAAESLYFANVPVGGLIIIVVAILFNSYLKQNRQRQKTKLPPRTVKEAPILLFILLQSFCLIYLFILVVVRSPALSLPLNSYDKRETIAALGTNPGIWSTPDRWRVGSLWGAHEKEKSIIWFCLFKYPYF